MRVNPRFAQDGFTLVENVVSLLILSFVGLGFVAGMTVVDKMSSASHLISEMDKQVSDIADSLRVGLESRQIDFNLPAKANPSPGDKTADDLLQVKNLPMAWDKKQNAPISSCPKCQGRYGYVVQPFELYDGLYLVTLRMTHKQWPVAYKDFRFVVSIK